VIVPAVPDSAKRFEHQKQCLEMVCPACHRFFSIPFGSIEYREVTDEQLSLGYMSGQFTDPARLQ